MSDAETRIQARKDKLLRAASIIKRYLDCPKQLKGLEMSNEMLLRMGMEADCMLETAVLISDVLKWLDDEDYYDELAWELEGKPPV
jgi:hypothetical protein